MATYNVDGTTDYVPGESNARAVPPPALAAAAEKNNHGDEAHPPATAPHVARTPHSKR